MADTGQVFRTKLIRTMTANWVRELKETLRDVARENGWARPGLALWPRDFPTAEQLVCEQIAQAYLALLLVDFQHAGVLAGRVSDIAKSASVRVTREAPGRLNISAVSSYAPLQHVLETVGLAASDPPSSTDVVADACLLLWRLKESADELRAQYRALQQARGYLHDDALEIASDDLKAASDAAYDFLKKHGPRE